MSGVERERFFASIRKLIGGFCLEAGGEGWGVGILSLT